MKKGKRLLASVLVMSMLLSLGLPVSAAGIEPVKREYQSYDFEAYELDAQPPASDGWTSTYENDTSHYAKVVTEGADSANKVLCSYSNSSAVGSLVLKHSVNNGPLTQGSFSYRALLCRTEANTAVHLYGTKEDDTQSQAVSVMSTKTPAWGHRPGTSSGTTVALQTTQINQWSDITIRFYLNEENAGVYDLWINGECKVEGATFRNAEVDNVTEFGISSGTKAMQFYVDDIVIRPGPMEEIQSLTLPEDKEVAWGSAVEDLALPETVRALFTDNTYIDLPVTWACADYDGETQGAYTFTATPDPAVMGGNYTLKAEAATSVTVTVGEKPASRDITAVAAVPDIQAEPGTAQAELGLPERIAVTLDGSVSDTLAVVWSCDTYDAGTEGTYTFSGTLTLPEDGFITNSQGLTASAQVTLFTDPHAAEFRALGEKYKAYLVGGLDNSDTDMAAYITEVDNTARNYYTSMIKKATRDGYGEGDYKLLWTDLTMNTGYNGAPTYAAKDTSVPAREEFNTVRDAFNRLLDITEAYSIQGCQYYQDEDVLSEVLSAYDFLVENYYNETVSLYGNWYTWEIAVPQAFLKALLILGDKVPQARLNTYLTALKRFVVEDNTKGPTKADGLTAPGTQTGANLLDKASSSAMIAVLDRDTGRMDRVLSDVKTVLVYTHSLTTNKSPGRDGFWEDGSYIQHEAIAYNGGYGATLYRQLGIFLHIFNGTDWDFSYPQDPTCAEIMFQSVFDGVEPLLADGRFMDMVGGRMVSRKTMNDRARAAELLAALLPYMDCMPQEMDSRLKSMLKHNISRLEALYFGYRNEAYTHVDCAYSLAAAKDLLNDSTVAAYDGGSLHKSYPAMDKVVHSTAGGVFALSMHSTRIFNHEFINNEGKRTWNMSDGMTYLYQPGDDQYGGGYWATVDPRRLPGTTSEFVMRPNGAGQDKVNPNAQVGMTELDGAGVAGMYLKTLGNGGKKDGAEAKKSWFMFDDEIVALGTGVTSTTGNYVETVVDNRRIDAAASNVLSVNGAAQNVLDNSPEITDSVEEEGGNRYFRLTDKSDSAAGASNGNGKLIYSFGQQSGQVYIQADIKVTSLEDGKTNTFYGMNVQDASGANCSTIYGYSNKNGESGKLRTRVIRGGNSDTDIGSYPNNWTTLKVRVDPDVAKCYVSVNGGTEQEFDYSVETAGAPAQVVFTTQGNNTIAGGMIDVDNVKVWTDTTTILEEDFENFSINSLPSGWTVAADGDKGITAEVKTASVDVVVPPKGTVINNAVTAHIAGEGGTGIGYYFPAEGGASIKALKEVRTGDWSDVGATSGPVSNGYATITVDHGANPVDGSYAYAILPGKSVTETQSYADAPGFEILAQTNEAHIVKDTEDGVTGAFFWGATPETVGGFSTSGAAAVMMKELGDDKLQFSISEPTQTADSLSVTCAVSVLGGSNIVADPGVTVTNTAPLTVRLDTTGAYGKTFHLTVTKNTSAERTVTAVAEQKVVRVAAGTTPEALRDLLPQTVRITLSDLTTEMVAVNWNLTGYDPNAEGRQSFTGTITLPDGVTDPDGHTASITVRVGTTISFDFEKDTEGELPEGWRLAGTGVADNPDTSWAKVIKDGDNQYLAVSATTTGKDAYASVLLDPTMEGETLLSARIMFPSDPSLNAGENVASALGIHLLWGNDVGSGTSAGNNAVSIMTHANGTIGYRKQNSSSTTAVGDVLELGRWYALDLRLNTETETFSMWLDGVKLVENVACRYAKGSENGAGVLRVAAPSSTNGTYCIDDIVITKSSVVEITAVTQPEPVQADYATAFAELPLPRTVIATLADGSTAELEVTWSGSDYNNSLADVPQVITGKLRTGAAYTGVESVTIQVTLRPDAMVRDITAVGALPPLNNVALGSTLEQVAAQLPGSVEVTVTGNATKTVPITGWSCEGYVPNTVGRYTFVGALDASGLITNTAGLTAQVTVWVGMDEFDMLRARWYYEIAGDNDFDESDPDMRAYVANLEKSSQDIKANLVPDAKAATDYGGYYAAFMAAHMVFTDYPMTAANNTGSSQRSMTYDRLKTLALTYRTKTCGDFENEQMKDLILAAMDYMYDDNKYSTTSGSAGNWYDWQIGTPLRFLDLMVLMYDELTQEQITKFTGAVDNYSPTANTRTGANRIWKCSIVAENAILSKNAVKLASVAPAVKNELDYVTSGDGYYADGSFVQHDYFAYTGGYGKALVVTMAPMMVVLDGTQYAIKYEDGAEQVFFDAILKTYAPVIVNNVVMDMVRCREISRIGGQDHVSGRQVIRALITLTQVMEDGEQKDRVLSLIKEYLVLDQSMGLNQVFRDNDISEYFLEYYISLAHILRGKEIMGDDSVKAAGPLTGYYNFADMARVVQRQADYSVGIAMHGGSVRTYEVTNTEGTNMWHTADGMFYLYNSDLSKYSDNFWGTVDHQRLPGTTVDRWDKAGNWRAKTTNTAGAAYGGAQWGGLYGATAFQVDNGVSSNKSYFLFDDEAVLMGSGVTSTSGNPVETIVENYKLKADGSNAVTVDGVAVTAADTDGKVEGAKYAHVEGNVAGADVGYVFPQGADVVAFKESRTQKWTLMNNYEKFKDDRDVTNHFATLYIDHGVDPTKAGYQYIVLPGKNAQETAEYSEKEDVEILTGSENVHAVRENTLGLTAVNFFAAGESAEAKVSADKPASVLYGKDDEGNLSVSVADVTNKASGSITVTLGFAVVGTPRGEHITVEQRTDSTVLTVDVTGSRGQSRSVTFVEEQEPEPTPIPTPTPTPTPGSSGTTKKPVATPKPTEPVKETVKLEDGTTIEKTTDEATGEVTAIVTLPEGKDSAVVTIPMEDVTPGTVAVIVHTDGTEELVRLSVPTENGLLLPVSGNVTVKLMDRGKDFEDVTPEQWYAGDVRFVTARQLFQGTSETTFAPNTVMDRGMIATVLYRLDGAKKVEDASKVFTDVEAGQWYSEGVSWAARAGVVKGYAGGSYGPADPVTREQLVTMLHRYVKGFGLDVSSENNLSAFRDADQVSDYAKEAMAWAVEQGIIRGKDGAALDPGAYASRAEVAAIMERLIRLLAVASAD